MLEVIILHFFDHLPEIAEYGSDGSEKNSLFTEKALKKRLIESQ